mgnify:CR=1 FL=1
MEVQPTKRSITVTLNEEELKYLMDITQNSLVNPDDEPESETKLRLQFFVMASRALGYDTKEDGSMSRSLHNS